MTDEQLEEFLIRETQEERLRIIYDEINENKISRILFRIWKGEDKEIYLIKKHIETDRRKIIAEAHEGILGGHYSKDITVQRIRNMTNWPNITRDVEDFIKTCDLCQRFKENERRQEYYEESDIPEAPNDKISIDLMGPLDTKNYKRKQIYFSNSGLLDQIYTFGTINRQNCNSSHRSYVERIFKNKWKTLRNINRQRNGIYK